VCKHWNSELYFCNFEKRTINPDELGDCSEACKNYAPKENAVMVSCRSCGNEFAFHPKRIVEIGSKEYATCPFCGHVNIKTNDESLSRGSE
jgi:uncharacterized Zn-finger protein